MACNSDDVLSKLTTLETSLNTRLTAIEERLTALENANYQIDVTDAVRDAIAPLLSAIQQQ